MNVIEKLAEEGGHSISRAGAWAVLACGLVLALLLAIYGVGSKLLPPMSNFVMAAAETTQQNAENFAKLTDAMKTVHVAHADMMKSMEITQQHVAQNGEQIKSNGEQIKLTVASIERMLKMMNDAYTMMESAPVQREQQVQLLQEIKQAIDEMSAKLPPSTNNPDSPP